MENSTAVGGHIVIFAQAWDPDSASNSCRDARMCLLREPKLTTYYYRQDARMRLVMWPLCHVQTPCPKLERSLSRCHSTVVVGSGFE